MQLLNKPVDADPDVFFLSIRVDSLFDEPESLEDVDDVVEAPHDVPSADWELGVAVDLAVELFDELLEGKHLFVLEKLLEEENGHEGEGLLFGTPLVFFEGEELVVEAAMVSGHVVDEFEFVLELGKPIPEVDVFLNLRDHVESLEDVDYVVNPSAFHFELLGKSVEFDLVSRSVDVHFEQRQAYIPQAAFSSQRLRRTSLEGERLSGNFEDVLLLLVSL